MEKENFILKAIELKIKQETEKVIEKAKQDLEKRTPEIVASVIIDVMKMAEMQTLQDRVIFTIRKKD